MMLMACVANPIFINTIVVFIRLYWFEQRFDHIVKERQRGRRTRTRSRTVSEEKEEPDLGRVEAGVNGRPITVLHHTTKPNGLTGHIAPGSAPGMSEKDRLEHLAGSISSPESGTSASDGSGGSVAHGSPMLSDDYGVAPHEIPGDRHNENSHGERHEKPNDVEHLKEEHTRRSQEGNWLGRNPVLKREITFADEVRPNSHRRQTLQLDRTPGKMSNEHHIAFLERQRNNHTTGALRIPGPRDFDRGDMPREVDAEVDHLQRSVTRNTLPAAPRPASRQYSPGSDDVRMNEDDHPPKRNIIIDEPERPKRDHAESTDPALANDGSRSRRINLIAPLWRLRHKAVSEGPAMVGRSMSAFSRRTMSFSRSQDRDMADPMPYLSWQPTIGRNSMFIDLTEDQREELGGVEYRSLKTLAIILVSYFFGFHILGVIVLTPWIVLMKKWGQVLDDDGQSRAWWGIFTPASMFNDLGFTLTPESMVPFQTAVLPLLFGSFLIIIGNTGFPCMLRFVIWLVSKFVPHGSGIWEELKFLLDHPRRCFTLMFPSRATWWLFWVLVLLNGIDLIFFIILDLNDSTVTVLSPGFRVLNGWFQAASTRTAGFACVNLADLHPAIQVSYLIMMYISVFPIAISVRRTNVYEEKSLGIWGGEEEDDEEGRSYVGQHLRRQLSFDLWYIFLGFFIITIVEGGRIEDNNAYAFTMFAILFEIVSAYGTVGLSLGYPGINASFSAEFGVISKLVIIAMMIRGRHRGLPYALDRAILLPSENREKKESEAGRRRSTVATGFGDGDREQFELDDMGHQRPRSSGDHRNNESREGGVGLSLRHQRRGSTVSTMSKRSTDPAHNPRKQRKLSNVFMAGLSAGPTVPNRKLE